MNTKQEVITTIEALIDLLIEKTIRATDRRWKLDSYGYGDTRTTLLRPAGESTYYSRFESRHYIYVSGDAAERLLSFWKTNKHDNFIGVRSTVGLIKELGGDASELKARIDAHRKDEARRRRDNSRKYYAREIAQATSIIDKLEANDQRLLPEEESLIENAKTALTALQHALEDAVEDKDAS